jgi:hypothetical protein
MKDRQPSGHLPFYIAFFVFGQSQNTVHRHFLEDIRKKIIVLGRPNGDPGLGDDSMRWVPEEHFYMLVAELFLKVLDFYLIFVAVAFGICEPQAQQVLSGAA